MEYVFSVRRMKLHSIKMHNGDFKVLKWFSVMVRTLGFHRKLFDSIPGWDNEFN